MNAPTLLRARHPVAAYSAAVVGSGIATALAAVAHRWLGVSDLSLVFMLAVLVVATRTHAGPAALTAVLCFLSYNFFFLEPRYTLYISARHGVATVLLFLAAALLAGRLASRLAEKVDALGDAQRYAAARQALSHQLSVAGDEAAVIQAAQAGFGDALGATVWIRLVTPGQERPSGTSARESVEHHGWWSLPLRAPGRVLGTLGLKLPEGLPRLDALERDVARAMADDVAQALSRTRLAGALEAERVAAEAERLRSALLASVSHDLRTPLASIVGAAESLEEWGDSLDAADRCALLATIREEGLRLESYIQNLLDMTRIGQGIRLVRQWVGIDELLGAALARVKRHRPTVQFRLVLTDTVPPVHVQGVLVEQALHNVLDNAAKFAGEEGPITVELTQDAENVFATVGDCGPGIPADHRQRVFDMFHRIERGDRGPPGTGLGLSIARAMIEAHGGSVVVDASQQGGARVTLSLPKDARG